MQDSFISKVQIKFFFFFLQDKYLIRFLFSLPQGQDSNFQQHQIVSMLFFLISPVISFT